MLVRFVGFRPSREEGSAVKAVGFSFGGYLQALEGSHNVKGGGAVVGHHCGFVRNGELEGAEPLDKDGGGFNGNDGELAVSWRPI